MPMIDLVYCPFFFYIFTIFLFGRIMMQPLELASRDNRCKFLMNYTIRTFLLLVTLL